MIVMIDNYDSFTYNLVHAFGSLGVEIKVFRNDVISAEDVIGLAPAAIVISPGPCTPKEAGISVELIRRASGRIPLLGVCLGHQAIGEAFGAKITGAKAIMHGKTSMISHNGKGLYANLKNPFTAGRYHSLAIARESLPPELLVEAESEDGEIMGVRHRDHCVYGIQFHPESVLTPSGKRLLKNFLEVKDKTRGGKP
ncbi:MAG: aminodeoxychorismate/anthranilate synthase component II [Kiritimatiellae bacterium]|nr:aminodeoxychorismate/anthranilate synthase component II [Kiritimatiellia bacterium]